MTKQHKRQSSAFAKLSKLKAQSRALLGYCQQQMLLLPALHRILILTLAGGILLLSIWPTPSPTTDVIEPAQRQSLELTMPPAEPQTPPATPSPPPPPRLTLDIAEINGYWQAYVIAPGDSLAKVFRDLNLPPATLQLLLSEESQQKELSRILPGQILSFYIADNNELIELQIKEKEQIKAQFTKRIDQGFLRESTALE